MPIPFPVALAIATGVRIVGKQKAKQLLKHMGTKGFVKAMKNTSASSQKNKWDAFLKPTKGSPKKGASETEKWENFLRVTKGQSTKPTPKSKPDWVGASPKGTAKPTAQNQKWKEFLNPTKSKPGPGKAKPKPQTWDEFLKPTGRTPFTGPPKPPPGPAAQPKTKAELLMSLRDKAKGAAGKAGGAAKGAFNHLRSGGPAKRGLLRKAGSALFNPVRNPITAGSTYAYGAWKMGVQPYSERNLDSQGLVPVEDRHQYGNENYFDTLRDRPRLDPKTGMPFDKDINNKTELFDRYIEALQGGFNGTISDFEQAIKRQGVYNDIREQELR